MYRSANARTVAVRNDWVYANTVTSRRAGVEPLVPGDSGRSPRGRRPAAPLVSEGLAFGTVRSARAVLDDLVGLIADGLEQ